MILRKNFTVNCFEDTGQDVPGQQEDLELYRPCSMTTSTKQTFSQTELVNRLATTRTERLLESARCRAAYNTLLLARPIIIRNITIHKSGNGTSSMSPNSYSVVTFMDYSLVCSIHYGSALRFCEIPLKQDSLTPGSEAVSIVTHETFSLALITHIRQWTKLPGLGGLTISRNY